MNAGANECDPLELALAEAIDAEFYAFVYGDLPHGHTAVSHYVSVGWRAGCDPNPWFSTQAYLEANPDAVAAGEVPLYHFLRNGGAEGQAVPSSTHAYAYYDRAASGQTAGIQPPARPENSLLARARPSRSGEEDLQRRIVADEFDAAYYLAVNPDVAAASVDPLTHFLGNGWHEGRDPNAYFSVRQYLEANVDVAEAGVNPFFHFLAIGKGEGRPVRLRVGFRHEVLARLLPVEERLKATPDVPAEDLGTREELRAALRLLLGSERRRLFVSVSHDDYTSNVGGLQFCLSREALAFGRMGVDYVHLFPGRPLLVTAREESDPVLGVLVNGAPAGYFRACDVSKALEEAIGVGSAWPDRAFAIHSCLGHNVAALADILRNLRLKRGHFWVHDFASICAGYSLLRNDVAFCGAPPIQSPACALCVYGERRDLQIADHERLFAEFTLTVVAPSQSALDIWTSATSLPADRAVVHPHCELTSRGVRSATSEVDAPLRVAFLGHPSVHKGWPVFRELVLRFGRDERYSFYHLGMSPIAGLPVTFAEVSVTSEDPGAMIDAIETHDIDVALIWSIWPETFCLTAHEAVAGGAAVIAPSCSGHVAAFVSGAGHGLVLSDEEELYGLFSTGEIEQFGKANRRAQLYGLEFSNMTADFVKGDGP